MNDTTTERSLVTVAPASPATQPDDSQLQEEVEEATLEVAEATDPIATGGAIVEPQAQAEQVAAGMIAAEAEPELTRDVRREVSRSVFRLAWPAITENALQTLLGIVDTAVVARLGTAALSGVGAAQQLIWVLTTALVAVSMGTTVLVARFTGAGEKKQANVVLKQSLMLAAIAAIILFPISFLSEPLLAILGLPADGVQAGATYLQITLQMSIFLVMMFVAGAALRGAGDTKTPMLVTAFINIINAVLAIQLVFGGAKAGLIFNDWLHGITNGAISLPTFSWIPELGVAGSAWAAAIARGIGTALLLSVFFLPRARLRLVGSGSWRPNFSLVGRLLNIGIPSAVEQMLMSLGVLAYSIIVVGMGETVFATSRLAINAVFLSQMPGVGFAIAATTLVGQNLGAGQPHKAQLGARLSAQSALIWMTLMGAVFFFFGREILMVFTDDPALLDLGAQAMKVIAFNQPFLALAFVLAGALRGAGDVRYPMVVTTIAVWCVRLPVAAFLGMSVLCIPGTDVCIQGLNLGLPGVYGALIIEAFIRALLFFIRFNSGKWKTMRV